MCAMCRNEQLHVQVCLCNLVRVAMDGQTVVNPMFEALDVADGDIFTFFFEVGCYSIFML